MDANNNPTKVEMPVTDEDLVRLKEWTRERRPILMGTLVYEVVIRAIARLEASEAKNKRSALWHDGECEIMNGVSRNEEECDCGSYQTHANWLKVTGKD